VEFLALRPALADRDFCAARSLSHKLKGAAANVGALEFAAELGELEQSCANDIELAHKLYEALRAAQPVLFVELNAFSMRETA
jgi:HPt (histidine-containing phosphotransfer) domain-containing protein